MPAAIARTTNTTAPRRRMARRRSFACWSRRISAARRRASCARARACLFVAINTIPHGLCGPCALRPPSLPALPRAGRSAGSIGRIWTASDVVVAARTAHRPRSVLAKQRRNRQAARANSRPGGGPPRTTQDPPEPTEAMRQAQARGEARARRQRALTVVGAVVVVIAVVVVVGAVLHKNPKSGAATSAAPVGVVQQVSSVPVAVLAEIGKGDASGGPKSLSGQPVAERGGHPTVLYVGAEWCPYCATERWPMVVALSRFGTFSNLGRTESSPSDVYPKTQTFSLHGATYTSQYLTLDAK